MVKLKTFSLKMANGEINFFLLDLSLFTCLLVCSLTQELRYLCVLSNNCVCLHCFHLQRNEAARNLRDSSLFIERTSSLGSSYNVLLQDRLELTCLLILVCITERILQILAFCPPIVCVSTLYAPATPSLFLIVQRIFLF